MELWVTIEVKTNKLLDVLINHQNRLCLDKGKTPKGLFDQAKWTTDTKINYHPYLEVQIDKKKTFLWCKISRR